MVFIFTLFLPFLWILYFLNKDKHPEPVFWLFIALQLGMLAAFLSFYAEYFFSFLKEDQEIFYYFLAALIEEFFKFLVIWALIFPQKVFDEPIDAMIYMMFSALGFSLLENISIFLRLEEKSHLLIVGFYRFLSANFLHILVSSMIGYGYSIMIITRRVFFFILTFFSAVFLHFIYNFVIINSTYGFLQVVPLLWAIFLVVLSELNYFQSQNGGKWKS